jgi:hypothetical protein
MKSKYTILLLLTLLPTFASALIAPEYFTPIRVPLYLVAIIVALIMMTKQTYYLITFPAVYSAIFFMLLLTSAAFNSALDSPVVYRQFLYHVSLFFCIYIGYLAFRSAVKWGIDYPRLLTVMFVILFGYGIYTYYAQVYELFEFLLFLRPSPSLKFIDAEQIFSQNFHGALNRYRAYSVWYEPSYASLALACALPLLFLCESRKLSLLFLFASGFFAFLTYSRSAWLVCFVFALIYGWSLIRIRFPVWLLGLLLISMIPLSLFAGFLSVVGEPDVSALVRFYNSVQAIAELDSRPWAIIVGLGSPDLIEPPMFGTTASTYITSAFIGVLHWLGVVGFVFLMAPFVVLLNRVRYSDDSVYWAVLSFVFLIFVAMNLGGNFVGLSLLWFFLGVYYAIAEHAIRMKKLSRRIQLCQNFP